MWPTVLDVKASGCLMTELTLFPAIFRKTTPIPSQLSSSTTLSLREAPPDPAGSGVSMVLMGGAAGAGIVAKDLAWRSCGAKFQT